MFVFIKVMDSNQMEKKKVSNKLKMLHYFDENDTLLSFTKRVDETVV